MAVVKVAFTRFGAIFTALAADSKPTTGIGLLSGSILIETDTSTIFEFDGSAWAALASGTPNVEVVIPAGAMRPTATAGAGAVADAETSTNKNNYTYIPFDAATEENAFFVYSLPSGWDEGTITFRFKWTNAAGLAAETVVLGLKCVAISDGDPLDVAWGSEVTVTDTFLAQEDNHISDESTAVTVGGTPVEGDLVLFNVARKTGSDDLTGDMRLMEVIVTFVRESSTD